MSELNEQKFSKVDYQTKAAYSGRDYWKKAIPTNTDKSSWNPSNTNTETVVIEIPTGAQINPNLSELSYDIKISQSYTSAVTGTNSETFTTLANAELPLFIQKIELEPKKGGGGAFTKLVDLTDIPEFVKLMNPRQTPADEYKKRESNTCFYPCNLAKYTGAMSSATLSNANFSFDYTDAAISNVNSDNFTEPQHIIYGDTKTCVATAATVTSSIALTDYIVPLRIFPDTFFAIDKNIDIPQDLNLTITFGRMKEMVAGMVNDYKGVTSTLAPTVTITNIKLNMVKDLNPTKRDAVSVIPFPYMSKAIPEDRTGKQTHTLKIPLDPNIGPKVRKIYATPYLYSFTRNINGTDTNCSCFGYFDNSNFFESSYYVGTNSMTSTNTKCTNYLPYLDTVPKYEKSIYISASSKELDEDFKYNYRLYHKDDKVDSIFSKNQYYQNWAICHDFTGGLSDNVTNISAGMIITDKEHTWTCDVEHPHTATQRWFEFVIYERYLVISPTKLLILNYLPTADQLNQLL